MTSIQHPAKPTATRNQDDTSGSPAERAYDKATKLAEEAWLICEKLNDRRNAAMLRSAIAGMYDSRDALRKPWTAAEILKREG